MRLTKHAAQRSRQRGLRVGDLQLIRDYGTETSSGYLLCRRDVERARAVAQRLERLEGKFLAADGDAAITVYHATERQQRRLLR